MTHQNKKRKQSSPSSGGCMEFGTQQIESLLFEEMTAVNSKLIYLGNNFNLVDNLYFANNNNMIDEFIGNMKQFIKQLNHHRKRVAFVVNINSDILSHIYQFLNTNTLVNCCGLVCKLWRESLIGLKMEVSNANVASFLQCSIINHVTELNFKTDNVESFETLSNCKNLNKLKKLRLAYNKPQMGYIEHLTKCNMPNLTELHIDTSHINEQSAIELFNSNFMSTIKKLISKSNCLKNNFYEYITGSKYLNQITHLTILNNALQTGKRIDLFLNDTINLEDLDIEYYELYSNFLKNGNYMNLTRLCISQCYINSQAFANLFISPNLPNLKTINADNIWADDNTTIAVFPSNSQSSITELSICHFKHEHFPSLLDHCKKLKKLIIYPGLVESDNEESFRNMFKSANLSNLEILQVSFCDIVEEIFSNPIYSNLKDLGFETDNPLEDVKFTLNCTNLVNLTRLDLLSVHVKEQSVLEDCSKAIQFNPTFSKLKHLDLPFVYKELF